MGRGDTSPREDWAKRHSLGIKAQIVKLLQENSDGLNFNKIFGDLHDLGELNSYSLLSSNLKELMHLGFVEREEVEGPGIPRQIYRLVDAEMRSTKRGGISRNMTDLLETLPCLSMKVNNRGEIVRVNVEKGKKEEFLKAVKAINAVAEYYQPLIKHFSKGEKQFFLKWLENTRLLLLLPSTILREEDPTQSDAAWRIYLTLVMKRFEELFDDFALNISPNKTEREKSIKNLRNLRNRFLEVSYATIARRINLDRITFHEVSPMDIDAKKLVRELKKRIPDKLNS